MRILVTFALETEFSPWRALRKFRRSKWNQAEVFRAQICTAEVNVLLTGVGTRQAAQAMSKLVGGGETETVECCISAGLAGALRPEYQVGQILVAEAITSERVPEHGVGSLKCSVPLVSFAEDCGATAVRRFFTSERAISRADEKEYLGSIADAVEMESFAVLSRARSDGVPGIAIRSISDTADEDLPLDMNGIFTESGGVSFPRVIGQVALRPHVIPQLVKLGHNSKRAAESLAAFLDRYIREFSRRAKALESGLGMQGSLNQ